MSSEILMDLYQYDQCVKVTLGLLITPPEYVGLQIQGCPLVHCSHPLCYKVDVKNVPEGNLEFAILHILKSAPEARRWHQNCKLYVGPDSI